MEQWTRARRETGLAEFERTCRLTTEAGRRKKAWKVPGTDEAGKHSMLTRRCQDLVEQWKS